MSEIEQLREELKVLEKYDGEWKAESPVEWVKRKIRHLEAEAADPWWDAKEAITLHIEHGGNKVKSVAQYASHLAAEVDRLEKRVKDLEAEQFRLDPETGTLVVDHAGPILDPARVLATAAEIFDQKGQFSMRMAIAFYCQGATPYRLKGTDE